MGNRNKALREFQNRSVKERSKFETENGNKFVQFENDNNSANTSDKATMAVVTFVIAIDGDSTKLNKIDSVTDVEQALRQIASDSMTDDCLQNAEILWTPEDRSEALSVRDIVADYPQLLLYKKKYDKKMKEETKANENY